MTDKQFNLANECAKNFGDRLNEAYDLIVGVTLSKDFDRCTLETQDELVRVLNTLSEFYDMWDRGQIILISQEREGNK